MFKRIAIVNRGEAAMRLIHAVRDLNAEHPDAATWQAIAALGETLLAAEADGLPGVDWAAPRGTPTLCAPPWSAAGTWRRWAWTRQACG